MYQVIELETGVVLASFESQAEAQTDMAVRTAAGAHVFFKRAPDLNWIGRETSRFWDGTYTPLVWSNEIWWQNRQGDLRNHFAHRSSVTHGLVAYTESAEKGEQDRQTVCKPGVYLTRYFSTVLTVAEIAHWVRLHCMSKSDSVELLFATSSDDIVRVYQTGPESCMSGPVSEYDSRIHPVTVYGDSDLSIAYVEAESEYHDRPIASRALVWADRKVYGRVYPTPERYNDTRREMARIEHDKLIQALESAGYRPGSFNGAKIQAIPHRRVDESYVMPYLDGSYCVDLVGDSFILGRDASFEAQSTDGVINLEPRFTCEHCNDSADPEDASTVRVARYSTESWCSCCFENHTFYCTGTEESYSEDVDSVSDNDGNSYCQYYARDEMFCCDLTGNWYTNDEAQDVNVNCGNTETWGEDALEDQAFRCSGSNQYYATRYFNQVEIDGETYEKIYAESDPLLSTRLKEMEQAEEYNNIAQFNIVLEGAI